MKTVLVAVLTLAVSFGVSAKISNVEFRAIDKAVDTQVCIAAAQGGMEAAKATAKALGVNFSVIKRHTVCNDQSIRSFAAKFNKQEAQPQPKKTVAYKFVVADSAPASLICKDAVMNGLKDAATRHNLKDVYCNGELINRFVRKNRI